MINVYVICLCIFTVSMSMKIPTHITSYEKKVCTELPNDPTLSCHILQNGSWYCVPNTSFQYDGDDSY